MNYIMEKKRKFITLITIAVTTIAIWISLSSFKLYIEDSPSFREEIRRYVSENVLPLIKEQRNKLDQYLTSDEKAQIQEFRNRLKELRDERNTFRKERGTDPLSELTPELREEIMERRKEHRKVHREIMFKTYEIVNKHENEIEELLQPIEENIPDWMEDIREIRAETIGQDNTGYERGPKRGQRFRGNGNAGESGGQGYGRGAGYGRGPGGMGESGGFMGPGAMAGGRYMGGPGGIGGRRFIGFNFPLHPEAFVLFDPELVDELFDHEFSVLPTISPNPTNGMVRINLELNESEQVSINLFDRQGTKIRNLLDKTLAEGEHELIFDISDLSQGLYFYHIDLENKVQKGRILVE
jgi:hypothetical protein